MKNLAIVASIAAAINRRAALLVALPLLQACTSVSPGSVPAQVVTDAPHPGTSTSAPTSAPARAPAKRARPIPPKYALKAAQVLWSKVQEDLSRGIANGSETRDLTEADVVALTAEANELGAAISGGDEESLRVADWTTLEPWAARGIRARTIARTLTDFDATTDYGRVTNFRRLLAMLGVDRVPAPGADTPEFVARDMDIAKHNLPRELLGVPLLGPSSSDSPRVTTTPDRGRAGSPADSPLDVAGNKSIDPGGERLAPSFDEMLREMGPPSTFDEVFAEVRKVPRFKDEFETTSQLEDRQASALANCEPHYLVEAPVDPEYVRYDADRQVLVVVTYALTNTRASDDELNSLFGYGSELRKAGQVLGYSTLSSNIAWAFPRQQHDVGTYDGSNVFGATVTITMQEGIARGVFEREGAHKEDVWTEKTAPYVYGAPIVEPVAFEIKADPSTAKALKEGGLRAGILVAPRAPFFVTGVDRFSPTLRAPYDCTTAVHYLIGDIQCVALFDPSGQLLATRATR